MLGGLHLARRPCERGGRLLNAQIVKEPEGEDLAEAGLESGQGPLQVDLAVHAKFWRVGAPVGRMAFQIPASGALPPEEVTHVIASDLQEPGLGVRPVGKAVPRLKRAEKHLLHDVPGIGRVLETEQRIAVNIVRIGVKQPLDSVMGI